MVTRDDFKMEGERKVGDPSLEQLSPDDIVSVGTQRPPQTPDGEPVAVPGNSGAVLDNLGTQTQGQPQAQPSAAPDAGTTNEPPIDPTRNPSTGAPGTQPPSTEGQTQQAQENTPPNENGQQEQQRTQNNQQVTEPPEPQVNPWETVFNSLKTDAGVEFQNKDQFVDELKQYNAYKQDPFGFLPAEIKAHAEFIKAGGNTEEFYRLKSIDFKSLPDREILFQSHLRENPNYAKDPEFARMYFDDQFNKQYSILAEPKKSQQDFTDDAGDPDPKAFQDYQRQYTFAEKSLKFNSDTEREKLVAWQEQSTSPPQAQGTGMTQEEADRYRTEYQNAVTQISSSFNGLEVPVSDKPEENLKFGLNEQIKPQWVNDLNNPMEFFNELGLQKDGKLDLKKLADASFKIRLFDKLGPIATKLILEKDAKQTVTGRQINPQTVNPSVEPGAAHGDDELAEVADLISQKDFGGRRF